MGNVHQPQNVDHCWAFVNMVMNLQVTLIVQYFFGSPGKTLPLSCQLSLQVS
jgi:hypothetical protein